MMINELLNTKKKKIIAGCSAGVAVIAIGAGIYLMNQDKDMLVLKKDSITIEYGEKIKLDAKEYLDVTELSKDEQKDVLKNTKVSSNAKDEVIKTKDDAGNEVEDTKDYPAVGSYKLTLTYEDEKVSVKVKVKDTTKPKIEVPENVEVLQGTDLSAFDFKSLMSATDLAQLSDYTFDTSSVDVNTPGEYTAKVSVEDASKNKTEKEFKVTVIAPPAVSENEEVVTKTVTDPETGKKKTVVTTKPKENDNSNPSSGSGTASGGSSASGSNNNSSSNSNSSSGNSTSGSNSNSSSGSTGSGGGNNSNSGSNATTPTEPQKTLIHGYYAECDCGYFVKATGSVETAEKKLFSEGHGSGRNTVCGKHGWTAGSYNWYE